MTLTSWTPEPQLVREVNAQFHRALESYRSQPKLVSEHANHEESIQTGGYANRTLLELVQNAADAVSGGAESTTGRVEIVLDTDNEVLYCANDGQPFSAEGLSSIQMAYLSSKRGDEIGRFGLGFKSVLAVSDSPQVFSRSISFEFNTPIARELLGQANPEARKLPILRTASVADPEAAMQADPVLDDLCSWATTVVRLPAAKNVARLRTDIERFRSEFLLFVEDVREIKLRVVGDESYESTHVSRAVGSNRYSLESPGAAPQEWVVTSRMHEPSPDARRQVGEAISRSRVKVSVAVPTSQRMLRRGQFWSYFPLQDETSASALFNAPWSVNDDRTTLLRNDYNREILRTVAEMFVDALPAVQTAEDPAVHFDFMPARGREILSFGDELLTHHVPQIGAKRSLVPNASGDLVDGNAVLPLDFSISFDSSIYQAWSQSPHTGNDVPHWRCYQTPARVTRLRDLYVLGRNPEGDTRDPRKSLSLLPNRGLLSWLREWADGDDMQSAAHALKTVVGHSFTGIENAKVIPTDKGLHALRDRDVVFLEREADLVIDNAAFVEPAFLKLQDIREILAKRGFRKLDPEAVLRARVTQLSTKPSPEELTKLWDSALDLTQNTVERVLLEGQEKRAPIQVPTLDGHWAWPEQVFDLGFDLMDRFPDRRLDRERCIPGVAYRLGVVHRVKREYALEDELRIQDYREFVLKTVNGRLGPGDRPVGEIEFDHYEGPGPFSVLFLLQEVGAPEKLREQWTVGLLRHADSTWVCDDVETGRTFEVPSPVQWAVEQVGLLGSTHGYRSPARMVSPTMLRFEGLLPLLKSDLDHRETLDLPSELEEVPRELLREAVESEVIHSAANPSILTEFVIAATRLAYEDGRPKTIPAQVGRTFEPRPPQTVYVATEDEQVKFLGERQRPYLRAEPGQAEDLLHIVGCRKFEDNFAFSEVIEGCEEYEPVLDAFPGFRNTEASIPLHNARISRAMNIAKRVTTKEGVEDQPQLWLLQGTDLVVRGDTSESQVLGFISEAFDLRFDKARLRNVEQTGVEHQLKLLRDQAKAASTDIERLEIYFGPDDLKDTLPSGLWSALEAQDLVDVRTSVAELFLLVYGSDALKQLADNFREMRFPDVPTSWAGSSSAVTWVRKMGFPSKYAGERTQTRAQEFVVPGAVTLDELHFFQKQISEKLRRVLTQPSDRGLAQKGMVELPTGAGKTRVATQTVLRLFQDDVFEGTVLWIAQSVELCEQAVQTFESVWRYLGDERPLTIGRLWENHQVREPDTEFSVIVATDAKLDSVLDQAEYEWLRTPKAVFVDEAHRASTARYTRLFHQLGVDGRRFERPLVGLSATPFKGTVDNAEQTRQLAARFGHNRLSPFDDGEAYNELVGLGVLARVKHEVLQGVDVNPSGKQQQDINSRHLIAPSLYEQLGKNEQRMGILLSHVMKLIDEHPDWPVLIFTPSVLSAQVLAASLRYRGVQADSVSGQTGRQRRRDVISKFQKGEIQVLTNCDLLIQGFDAPGVRALYIARPTFSPSAYIQMAGRGLRGPKNGGKDECLIVDIEDNWGATNQSLGYKGYAELWRKQGGDSIEVEGLQA